jgi:hypothetical protein
MVIGECECGGDERITTWRLCGICMTRKNDLESYANYFQGDALLDALLILKKILPIMDFPKEFIPQKLHPGYDQWRDRILEAILSSKAEFNSEKGKTDDGIKTEDPGTASADTRREIGDDAEAVGTGPAE